jgi:zinc transport system substrate-binding protein
LKVFVSVTPLNYFVERIGGRHVQVAVMVEPGHSPHTYEPTPQQIAALSGARAYVRIGMPFEVFWIDRIQAIYPNLKIIDPRRGIDLLPMRYQAVNIGGKNRGGDVHSHTSGDPHVWLDPLQVKIIAENIRDELIELDRGNSDVYNWNTQQFLDGLDQLDADIRKLTNKVRNRRFLVFHPAWGYFARAYGLEQLSVEYEGKEPGPRTLANLMATVKQLNISTVFVQKQFSTRLAGTLATEIDGRVVVLDPLAEDYFDNLRRAAKAISGV